MNNFVILSLIFISAIVGFMVGSWLDSIRWDRVIRKMMEENALLMEENVELMKEAEEKNEQKV